MKDDITSKDTNKRIEKLDRGLYDPNQEHAQRPRRRIHGRNIELDHDFQDHQYDSLLNARSKYKLPTSLFKKIFFAALTFFVVVILIVGISLYEIRKTVSEDLIAMEVLGQPFVDGGEELELQIRIQNLNEQDLQLPDLVLSYPKDSSLDSEKVFLRRSLQDIVPQGRSTEKFDLVLFGQEGDMRSINATLEYRIDGSSSIFIKEAQHEVIIRSTPTQVLVTAPDVIVRNQEVTLAVDISSNSNTQINNTLLKINYPRGFEFIRANLDPNFNTNTWYFDNITTEAQTIEIVGRLAALEGQGQSFNIEYGKQNQFNKNQFETVFNALTHTIDVQKSFIETMLTVNNSKEDTSSVRGGGDIEVELVYENTLNKSLENISLEIELNGELYDPQKVRVTGGFYDSSRRVIMFDKTTSDTFTLLEPGESREVGFKLVSRDLVTAQDVLTNPEALMTVNVRGTEGGGSNRVALAVSSHTVQANSDLSLITKTQYYEGPFKNEGPIPPRVSTPSTYTLVFQVLNSSNKVSDTKLRTTLPTYVEWLNTVAPSIERNNVSFNIVTRELIWDIGNLDAGIGVGTEAPRQLSAQVRVTPSINQLGETVMLTGQSILSATDEFTETNLSYKKIPFTTLLDNVDGEGAYGRVVN
ncbi:MAG: hypothetical protein ACI870_000493 [Crocinitomicaceae bacterium]|jgi:hypothetical protein